jgi:hypothetical protein
LQATLLHELVHLSGYWRHNRRFARRLARAARDAWPALNLPVHPERAQAADHAVETALSEWHQRQRPVARLRRRLHAMGHRLVSFLRARVQGQELEEATPRPGGHPFSAP